MREAISCSRCEGLGTGFLYLPRGHQPIGLCAALAPSLDRRIPHPKGRIRIGRTGKESHVQEKQTPDPDWRTSMGRTAATLDPCPEAMARIRRSAFSVTETSAAWRGGRSATGGRIAQWWGPSISSPTASSGGSPPPPAPGARLSGRSRTCGSRAVSPTAAARRRAASRPGRPEPTRFSPAGCPPRSAATFCAMSSESWAAHVARPQRDPVTRPAPPPSARGPSRRRPAPPRAPRAHRLCR